MPIFARASLALVAATFLSGTASANEVNIYTTREPGLIQPLLDAFKASTGITVNTVFLKDGLAERVASEGASSPADILMTVDAGNLVDLAEKGLTQPVESKTLNEAVPEQLRDAKGNWYALSLRARVVYASKDLELDAINYEDLSDPKWKGKICIRSGQHPYNTALFADYIAHYGAEKTEAWLTGLKANLARKAAGGDRDGAKDIVGGICDIAVANSYYVGLMRSGKGGDEQKGWGEGIKVILPTFKDGGTQVNISGAAVAKNAPHKEEAVKLLEYLVSDEAQKIYAEANYEYPVKPGAPVDAIVKSFGELNIDKVPLTQIVSHRKEASELVDKVGFDN
ncbi:Fe(3+) ABC transporter substrate-binding protein [Ochrobactrum soli]|uniref:Ferric iron ABC transporter, iron-binding protein n=1 Tax=Ochrobactrum soli TaxID=2448455 RepID=A0A2P9HGL3_9HYPH|nr:MULTISPECIES: Fe(3+) ABC transporter substrate-binding protein [Brucella]MCI1002791.1 Fe(3+) ABC transporter substrate-binding protein [Ochrobactrum sp. C6C9]RRD24578.1 Fe(3+) ABC transporter substrate-binding protein [Brucellaceae bacterium VT-16-1752]MDX4073395.1 Fe(3+) ABC transporter substrate-binding protein [Brucella sp. NBRC 113783]RLL74050.1 Fe(3+) ABC transporter substrate-binding protein [[Ochrobactrum] soli]SPL63248.1 Ferric iron ABC transporter, iron-binding protein [[Ochrobactr